MFSTALLIAIARCKYKTGFLYEESSFEIQAVLTFPCFSLIWLDDRVPTGIKGFGYG
jgi:hypothetical protein